MGKIIKYALNRPSLMKNSSIFENRFKKHENQLSKFDDLILSELANDLKKTEATDLNSFENIVDDKINKVATNYLEYIIRFLQSEIEKKLNAIEIEFLKNRIKLIIKKLINEVNKKLLKLITNSSLKIKKEDIEEFNEISNFKIISFSDAFYNGLINYNQNSENNTLLSNSYLENLINSKRTRSWVKFFAEIFTILSFLITIIFWFLQRGPVVQDDKKPNIITSTPLLNIFPKLDNDVYSYLKENFNFYTNRDSKEQIVKNEDPKIYLSLNLDKSYEFTFSIKNNGEDIARRIKGFIGDTTDFNTFERNVILGDAEKSKNFKEIEFSNKSLLIDSSFISKVSYTPIYYDSTGSFVIHLLIIFMDDDGTLYDTYYWFQFASYLNDVKFYPKAQYKLLNIDDKIMEFDTIFLRPSNEELKEKINYVTSDVADSRKYTQSERDIIFRNITK